MRSSFSIKTKLTIILTDLCNANCPFCVAKYGNKDENMPVDKLIRSFHFAVANTNVQDINISGGEPTMSKHLFPLLNEIEKHKGSFKGITLKTNGSMLRDGLYLENILNSCISVIAISCHHFNKNHNDELMGFDTLSRDEILRIYNLAKHKGKELRINLTINRSEICNVEKRSQFVQYFNGCADVIRLTPMVINCEGENEIEKYTKENAYTIEEYTTIINDFSDVCDKRLEKEPSNEFEKFRQFVYKNDQKIELRLHFPMEKPQKHDKITEVQLYPNGILCANWDREDKINID